MTNIVASTAVDQTFDASIPSGTTSYTVPSFSTNPPGSEASIVYTDVTAGKPPGITFIGRTYDWLSEISTP